MTKRFKKTTLQSDKPFYVGADLVRQQFKRPHPDEVWVSDITYIATLSGWIYCAVILDLYSRRVVGLAVDNHMRADLVTSALRQALIHRRPLKGLVHHSDKESQYTSAALKKMADAYGLRLSTGRVGNAYDNAVAESFFHTLKTEHVYFKQYKNLEEAKMDIFQYVYGFYNQKRRHSTLGYVSPAQFENLSCISKRKLS
jgi:transposase InsO family protein